MVCRRHRHTTQRNRRRKAASLPQACLARSVRSTIPRRLSWKTGKHISDITIQCSAGRSTTPAGAPVAAAVWVWAWPWVPRLAMPSRANPLRPAEPALDVDSEPFAPPPAPTVADAAAAASSSARGISIVEEAKTGKCSKCREQKHAHSPAGQPCPCHCPERNVDRLHAMLTMTIPTPSFSASVPR